MKGGENRGGQSASASFEEVLFVGPVSQTDGKPQGRGRKVSGGGNRKKTLPAGNKSS